VNIKDPVHIYIMDWKLFFLSLFVPSLDIFFLVFSTAKPMGLSTVPCSKSSELLTFLLVGHVQNLCCFTHSFELVSSVEKLSVLWTRSKECGETKKEKSVCFMVWATISGASAAGSTWDF